MGRKSQRLMQKGIKIPASIIRLITKLFDVSPLIPFQRHWWEEWVTWTTFDLSTVERNSWNLSNENYFYVPAEKKDWLLLTNSYTIKTELFNRNLSILTGDVIYTNI